MRKPMFYFCFCLFFLLLFYEVDIFSSFYLRKEEERKEILWPSEKEELEKKYLDLLNTVNLWDTTSDPQISKVVVHDPYSFFDEVTILKGKEEGVEVGSIVYNEFGYVGKVIETRRHSSIVELVTNSKTIMPVKIQNSYGVLEKEKEGMVVKHITSKEEIQIGSMVFTSEFSNIPKVLTIGRVEEVFNNGIEQVVKITPFLDVNQLNYCFIEKSVTYE